MSQAAKAQEPSMEEILASIRRIIADDEAKPAPGAPAANSEPEPEVAPPREPPAMSQHDIDTMLANFNSPTASQEKQQSAGETEDVLELTPAMESLPEPEPAFRTI